MHACKIGTRLLWKEWRQGRWVWIALVAVPPLAFFSFFLLFGAGQGLGRLPRLLFLALAAFGAPLLTALWAGTKANRAAPGAEFLQAHLPVRPLAAWCASFLIPLLVAALCGAWYGVCSEAFRYWHDSIWPPAGYQSSMFDDWRYFAPAEPAALGAVFLASCFAICYVVAMRTSLLPAALAGVLLTVRIGGDFAGFHLTSWEPLRPFGWLLPVAGAMASLAFTVLEGKRWLRVAQGAVLCVAAGLLLPLVLQYRAAYLNTEGRRPALPQVSAVEAPDASFLLEASPRDGPANHVLFVLRDRRSGRTRERAFARNTCVVDVRDRRYVYLAQQLPGQPRVKILLWDSAANAVRELASLPAGRNALPRDLLPLRCGYADPEARYLVLELPLRDSRRDLWLVNLRSGESALVFPDLPDRCFGGDRASWGEDRVILSGYRKAVVVDLAARRARFLRVPLRKGDKAHG